MQDNGLLKYYKEQKSKGEFLSTRTLPVTSVEGELEEVVKLNIKTPSDKVIKYYLKPTGRLETATEVLLSQIYAKAGLDTSTYLPILDGDVLKIISEEAKDENSILAKDFVNKQGFFAFSGVKGSEAFRRDSAKPINGLNVSEEIKVNNSCYTPSVIKQLILTRYLDTACFNDDRHLGNFFYKYSTSKTPNETNSIETLKTAGSSIILPYGNQKVQTMARGILLARQGLIELENKNEENLSMVENAGEEQTKLATGVKLIDYGASAYNIYGFRHYYEGVPLKYTLEQTDSSIRYFNDFYTDGQLKQNISRSGMVFCAKNSEEMQQYVTPTQLAEKIGSINVNEIKSDVENNLDFKIDSYLTDTLSASLDDLAENLAK